MRQPLPEDKTAGVIREERPLRRPRYWFAYGSGSGRVNVKLDAAWVEQASDAGAWNPCCCTEPTRADAGDLKRRGLWTRLNSHASGRRSGDQFCVYVCDRLIVPELTRGQQQIRLGALSLDVLTRDFIRANFAYRYVVTPDSVAAFTIERDVQRGALATGKPFLNPIAT